MAGPGVGNVYTCDGLFRNLERRITAIFLTWSSEMADPGVGNVYTISLCQYRD